LALLIIIILATRYFREGIKVVKFAKYKGNVKNTDVVLWERKPPETSTSAD